MSLIFLSVLAVLTIYFIQEKRALEEQMFGSMKRLDREEYSRVFKSTGIDVDGRREFLSRMLPSIENSLKVFINFAKAVPGFSSLPLNDQIALMKGKQSYSFIHTDLIVIVFYI